MLGQVLDITTGKHSRSLDSYLDLPTASLGLSSVQERGLTEGTGGNSGVITEADKIPTLGVSICKELGNLLPPTPPKKSF